jgi:hypothetical protein
MADVSIRFLKTVRLTTHAHGVRLTEETHAERLSDGVA